MGSGTHFAVKENTRLTSVFQIRADARAKFSHVGINKMINMITLTRTYITNFYVFYAANIDSEDRSVAAYLPNPAINTELLKEIQQWYDQGATVDDVIDRLRLKTVPPGYVTHSWIEGAVVRINCISNMVYSISRKR